MNARGILRQPSPTKKRNLTTQLINVKQPHHNVHLIDHNHVNDSENLLNRIDEKSKYCVTEMNSTKRVVRKLEHLKNLAIKPPTTTAELTPRTKNIVTEKALKKLNIVSDTNVFKHLPPVNVNDSILGINRKKIRKDKRTVSLSTVDHIPTLEKFLKPSVDLDYRLELSDSDFSDDESVTLQSLSNDNFKRLYDSYRRYFNPNRHSLMKHP